MIHRCLCDKSQQLPCNPFPEHNLLRNLVRLHLGFELDVEDLEMVLSGARDLSLECQDPAAGVHQGRVRRDRTP